MKKLIIILSMVFICFCIFGYFEVKCGNITKLSLESCVSQSYWEYTDEGINDYKYGGGKYSKTERVEKINKIRKECLIDPLYWNKEKRAFQKGWTK